ncbi:MAG: PTS sugar transporter subunit IIA [Anaerolineaceae bacterium]|nr:PTS sugar transporter subunit IIA [Anaerolineaceae bacterium]
MDLITEQLISFDEDLSSVQEVFQRISKILFNEGRVKDQSTVYRDLMEREGIIPTAMGNGIAIPHALSDTVITESITILRLKKPIQWTEGEKVKHIFSIAVPKANANQTHLKILSNIARNLLDDTIRRILFSSKDKNEIITQILSFSE